MFKRLTAAIIFICLVFCMMPFTGALEPSGVSAERSNTSIMVNGIRIPFRAYRIEGRTYVNLFEVALAFSGTENQFTLRWGEKNRSIDILKGSPHTAIGLNLARRNANNGSATPVDIDLLIDGARVSVPAYNIFTDVYFDLRGIANLFDFCIVWSPVEDIMEIDTRRSFEDSETIRRIDPSKPMIALTFDDGPSFVTVPILDALEQHGAVATFYVVGNRVTGGRDIVTRAFNMGNEIANHTWSHPRFDRMSRDRIYIDLSNTNDVIESVTGQPPSNMRPAYGIINERVSSTTSELGLPIIMWSLDPEDWRFRNADRTYEFVMEHVEDRDIILLHDIHEPTAEAAVRLIPSLINSGFQLVTVSELMYYSGIAPVPGEVYRSGVE